MDLYADSDEAFDALLPVACGQYDFETLLMGTRVLRKVDSASVKSEVSEEEPEDSYLNILLHPEC